MVFIFILFATALKNKIFHTFFLLLLLRIIYYATNIFCLVIAVIWRINLILSLPWFYQYYLITSDISKSFGVDHITTASVNDKKYMKCPSKVKISYNFKLFDCFVCIDNICTLIIHYFPFFSWILDTNISLSVISFISYTWFNQTNVLNYL